VRTFGPWRDALMSIVYAIMALSATEHVVEIQFAVLVNSVLRQPRDRSGVITTSDDVVVAA
jgi:hypothetical protein